MSSSTWEGTAPWSASSFSSNLPKGHRVEGLNDAFILQSRNVSSASSEACYYHPLPCKGFEVSVKKLVALSIGDLSASSVENGSPIARRIRGAFA